MPSFCHKGIVTEEQALKAQGRSPAVNAKPEKIVVPKGWTLENSILKKTIRVEKREKFEYRVEMWRLANDSNDPKHDVEMKSGYSIIDGSYIGDAKTANHLTNNIGVIPQAIDGKGVSSIGFKESESKGCGWSHRAISCFGVGDMLFEGKCKSGKTPFVKCGTVKISTLDQAKRSASNFAEYVS
tara:strand:- start:75 stop:626 length:552 start_codon:yes stop_codon:yes gene_type:complete